MTETLPGSLIAPVPARTTADRLAAQVRDIILAGDVAASSPIRQDELAARLSVSKIPLREALSRLEQDGLVISHPNRGYFVRAMSRAEAEEIYALRLKLEPEAAGLGAVAADDADRERARQALVALDAESAVRGSNTGPLNRAFHMALVTPGAGPLTVGMVERLHVMADRYVRRHLEPKDRPRVAETEHHDILTVWLSLDAAAVADEIATHLERTLDELRGEIGEA